VDPARTAPIDYVVLEFPSGSPPLPEPLSTELASLEEAELIHILDLVVVEKRSDGTVVARELEDVEDVGELRSLRGGLDDVLAAEDLVRVADAVAPGSVAAVVVWENTWAEPLVGLARECGGEVVATGRIPSLPEDG
jgi:hypothetical protein